MLSKEKAMDGVHLFVLDLDGTVYLGGSIEFVRELEAAKDRDFIFFTNNASKVPAVYVEIWTSEESRIRGRRTMTGSRGNTSRRMRI